MIPVVLVGEDSLCLNLLKRLVMHVDRGFEMQLSLVAGGAEAVKACIPRYRNACKAVPHVVLTDLDRAECPTSLLRDWGLARMPSTLMFRFAVREAESWLLADAAGLANWLGLPRNAIPADPESLHDPKQSLVNLARRSRDRRLREELIPAHGSVMPIGPRYNERFGDFVRSRWNPETASEAAPSLRRTLRRLRAFEP